MHDNLMHNLYKAASIPREKQFKGDIMGVVGFSLTRIKAQRFEIPGKGIKITNDASIMDVQEVMVSFGKEKQPTLRFKFHYKSDYEPKIAEIELLGEVMYLQDPKKLKEIEAHWKKNKSLPADIAPAIMNPIVSKCSVKTITLAEELNIPSPIPLPKVQPKK